MANKKPRQKRSSSREGRSRSIPARFVSRNNFQNKTPVFSSGFANLQKSSKMISSCVDSHADNDIITPVETNETEKHELGIER